MNGQLPAFVFSRNHVSWMLATANVLEKAGCQVVIVDLGSTYPPMMNWLRDNKDYDTIMLGDLKSNSSPWDLWELQVEYDDTGVMDFTYKKNMSLVEYFMIYKLGYTDKRFLATDFDLNLDIGDQFINMMHHVMDNHPDIVKCGPALHWQDAQTSYHKYEFINEVEEWENKFWDQDRLIHTVENVETYERFRLYDAPIDTTLAMYELGRIIPARPDPGKGIRIDADNTSCIHIPWTMPAGEILVDEETLYYVLSCRDDIGHWTTKMKGLIQEKMKMIQSTALTARQESFFSDEKAGPATETTVSNAIHIRER